MLNLNNYEMDFNKLNSLLLLKYDRHVKEIHLALSVGCYSNYIHRSCTNYISTVFARI